MRHIYHSILSIRSPECMDSNCANWVLVLWKCTFDF
jgi:hypothetical protein